MSDRESPEYQNIMQQQDEVSQILKLEIELEKDLLELRNVEEELSGNNTNKSKLVEWQEFIKYGHKANKKPNEELPEGYHPGYLTPREQSGEMPASAEWQKESLAKILLAFNELMHDNEGIVPAIKRIIARFFLIAKKEEGIEKLLKQLTDLRYLQNWLKEGKYEKWTAIRDKGAAELSEYFEQEEKVFFNGKLIPAVHAQMRYLQYIRELLKFLESNLRSFTELQELHVGILDFTKYPGEEAVEISAQGEVHKKWIDVTAQAKTPPGINQQLIRIWTNFASGIPPYKVACYVNGVKKAERIVNKNYDTEPVVQFTTEEIGQLNQGRNVISIMAISAKDTYRRASEKSIEIFISGRTSEPPQEYPPHEYPP